MNGLCLLEHEQITGVLTGLLAAFLAIVTVWLRCVFHLQTYIPNLWQLTGSCCSDLRQGVCPSEFWLNQDACCAGLEVCIVCILQCCHLCPELTMFPPSIL